MPHPRIARDRLAALLKRFPAVTLGGPRQIGKSTLVRAQFPDFAYLDLENQGDLRRMSTDPLFLLAQHKRLIVDEAQRFPDLFPQLRGFLDEHPRHRIVLLGSASPSLVTKISESLTGRTAFFELSGISVFEHDAEALWIKGAFPRIHWSRPRSNPAEWYPAYLRSSIEQDVPQLGFRIAPQRMRNLLSMLAHIQGGICNLSEIGGSLGINYHSVAQILDIFEGIFLARRLPPYFANIGKRLVKSPKIYVRDTGILHSLLGIGFTKRALLAHPKAGASFETFCIEQIIGHARLVDPAARAFYFRTQTGVEVDLILELRGRLVPIEIKLGVTPPETKSLAICMRDIAVNRGYVVNLSARPVEIARGIWMSGLSELLDSLGLRPARNKKRLATGSR